MTHLGVWKGSELLGHLRQVRGGIRFEFDRTILERLGLARPVMSMSMPTSARPYGDRAARPFFDGLLPEGEARRIIAYDFGIAEADTFGLLQMIGRDCAGALAILRDGDRPPLAKSTTTLVELRREEVDFFIANLRVHPLGVDSSVRASLGGVQEKLLLTARSDGSWALPTADVASTHLLKPAISGLTDSVANEAVCLRFGALVGVPAAVASVDSFGGRDVLVVQRFDRRREANGVITRMHQETACQALAVPVAATARKYEDAGGPSLRSIAQLLKRWSSVDQLVELLRQITISVVVGNADAHAMNVSFVINDDGAVTLSPIYDVFSTVAYPQLSTTPGMYIDGIRDIRAITRDNLINEATAWGVDIEQASETVASICDQAPGAMRNAIDDVGSVPHDLADLLIGRAGTFGRR